MTKRSPAITAGLFCAYLIANVSVKGLYFCSTPTMRTGQSLFNELTTIAPAPAGEVRKGRNAELIAKRDQLLVHRYVFYILYTELRPEAVNQRLVEEFHLQEGYLLNIVYSRAAEVRTFRKTPPTLSQLRSWHPHFTWVATK